LDSGVKVVEAGSFVRPDRVPQVSSLLLSHYQYQCLELMLQMADTASLLPRLRPFGDNSREVYYPVLVPNMRGLENLLKLEEENEKAGKPRLTNEIAIFVAASDVSHPFLHLLTKLTHRVSPKPTTVLLLRKY
jgi:hydroxymethylglutaryl-CoA lyase